MGDDEWACQWNKDNHLFDVMKCEPCCGDPCNPMDGAICFLNWLFCGPCSAAKLLSWSQDQECSCVNHCLLGAIPYCGGCMCTASIRHNLRVKDGTGPSDANCRWQDCLIANLPVLGCCSLCQELRSVPNDSWQWWNHISEFKLMTDPCIYPGCVGK